MKRFIEDFGGVDQFVAAVISAVCFPFVLILMAAMG